MTKRVREDGSAGQLWFLACALGSEKLREEPLVAVLSVQNNSVAATFVLVTDVTEAFLELAEAPAVAFLIAQAL